MTAEARRAVAVTGATGFLGRHLVPRLAAGGDAVRILSRRAEAASIFPVAVDPVEGDLRDPEAIAALLRGTDVLVHLAYPEDVSDAELEAMTATLASSAVEQRVRRFVHVSTAVVVGSTREPVITEETREAPETPYQRRKLRIEHLLTEALRGRVPLTILRPTAIFGRDGWNLRKLVDDLRRDPFPVRAARWALLKERRLNLVCVENVVESIRFAIDATGENADGCFIVSDDDAGTNNFGDVAAFMARKLSIAVPPVPSLTWAVPPLLRLRGRSVANPYSIFSPAKLRSRGFVPALRFEEGLERFAAWYLGEGSR